MTQFRFRLQKALDWRHAQLELEEARFKQQTAALDALDRRQAEWKAAGAGAEAQVRGWRPLAGGDLNALAHFRDHVRTRQVAIARQRHEAQKKLEERHRAMLKARQRYRLLERLKERRLVEWEAARDKELEEMAADSYLAGLARRGSL